MWLESERQAGRIKNWAAHVRVDLVANKVKVAFMKIDFKVIYPDGHHEWHEVKSSHAQKALTSI